MINHTIYDTATMLGVLRDNEAMQPPTSYWLDLCFPRQVNFDTEYVDLESLTGTRKLAPLVVPTAQGVPIYSNASRLTRIKPAYVKPKDPVTASRMITRQAGVETLAQGTAGLSPQARYNAIVADIIRQHRWAIERRAEWMASMAVQFAEVILEDERYPRTVVNFLRDSGHSKTLTGGNRWGDTGVSIMANIEAWRLEARKAKFGGVLNRLTIGSDVWAVMQADEAIRDLMKLDLRAYNNGINLNLGLTQNLDVEYVGTLGGNVAVYVYSDYYEDPDGDTVELMDPRDVVLTGPGIEGVRCYGAILDVDASFQPLAIFPKMWKENDPSATFIMHQSAPLMVPINPNCSMRVRVLA